MTGLHVVSKRLTTGRRWFVYAWRGGPCLLRHDGEEKPVITRELLDKQYQAKTASSQAASEDVDWLIKGYKASPKFTNTKPSTQRDYKLWLARISERFGKTPAEVFEDWRMRGDVIAWRDQWAHQPRTADKAVVMIVTLLNWSVENGKIQRHNCQGIDLLHHVDKSEEIWEDRHWAAIEAVKDFPPHVMRALKLAKLTGLRLGDLVALDWSQVFDKQITVERTRKRGGRAVIPIFPELSALLAEIGRKEGAVLLNSRGKPWTASGLETVWQRKQPADFDRTLHDLRGTFVTFLAVKGLTDEQIARVVGWTADKVAGIRARYVDEARVVVSLVERLSG